MRYLTLCLAGFATLTGCVTVPNPPMGLGGDATAWMISDTPQVGTVVEVRYQGSKVVGGRVRPVAVQGHAPMDPSAPLYPHVETMLSDKLSISASASFLASNDPQLKAAFTHAKSVSISADNLKTFQTKTEDELIAAVRDEDLNKSKDPILANMLSQVNKVDQATKLPIYWLVTKVYVPDSAEVKASSSSDVSATASCGGAVVCTVIPGTKVGLSVSFGASSSSDSKIKGHAAWVVMKPIFANSAGVLYLDHDRKSVKALLSG